MSSDEIRFTVRMPIRQYNALSLEAQRRHESMTTVLRTFVREGLERSSPPPRPTSQGTRRVK